MTIRRSDDFYLAASGSRVEEKIVHKFGRNAAVGTSFVPLCFGGVFQTPIAATALEWVSTSANDTAVGTGAQEITTIGLDSTWAEKTQTTETNGLTAVALGTNLIRKYRSYVSRSGTYGTTAAGSHAGSLTLQVASAGATWATIDATDYPRGQSEIGCFSVELGQTAFILGGTAISESSKAASLILFQRPNANDVTTPFAGAMRTLVELTGFTGVASFRPKSPLNPLVGPCDIIALGKLDVGTGSMEIDFEVLLTPT